MEKNIEKRKLWKGVWNGKECWCARKSEDPSAYTLVFTEIIDAIKFLLELDNTSSHILEKQYLINNSKIKLYRKYDI